MADRLDRWRSLTGRPLEGAFAFGDTPELADELLAYVERGTKRATVGSLAEQEAADEPFPAPGQSWGLLDGHDELRFVMETVEVSVAALGEVTAAFAWDEGEGDRTREDWLDGHRRFFARRGVDDPDALQVVFERFRIVWPVPDEPRWLTADVRELRWDERDWLRQTYTERCGTTRLVSRGVQHDVVDLPALVCERDGERIGACAFRPRPGGVAEVVGFDALALDAEVGAALTDGLRELARVSGWERVWLTAELELGQPNQASRWSRS